MGPKRKKALPVKVVKRARKVMTIENKIMILDKLHLGMSPSSLGREYQVNESTIRTIRANEEKIRASVQSVVPVRAKVTQPKRIFQIEEMERRLYKWINDQVKKGSFLDSSMIREKALSFYNNLISSKKFDTFFPEFQASKGWLAKFTRRYNLKDVLHDSRSSCNGTTEKKCVTKQSSDMNEFKAFKDKLNILYNSKFKRRSRKVMSLSQKLEILEKLHEGRSAASLGREYGVNESTIRTIRGYEEKIRAAIKAQATLNSNIIKKDPHLDKMEELLYSWVSEQTNINSAIDCACIREKARSLYQYVVESDGSVCNGDFIPTKGWLSNFITQFNLCNIDLSSSEPVDEQAAEQFKQHFTEFVAEKGYTSEQVFNAHETVLCYKKMDIKSCISDKTNFSNVFADYKNNLTLFFCSNASGDFKCKPLLVYPFYLGSLKDMKEELLPVLCRSNDSMLITRILFDDWFSNCFIEGAKEYLQKKNLEFKALLILDSTLGIFPDMLDSKYHPDIEIMILPPKTTAILQPLHLGVTKMFKYSYSLGVYWRATQALYDRAADNLMKFWKSFDMKDCISIIKESWDEISPLTINTCWYNLWPEVIMDFKGFPTFEKEIADIIKLATDLGEEDFVDIKSENTGMVPLNAQFRRENIMDFNEIGANQYNEQTGETFEFLITSDFIKNEVIDQSELDINSRESISGESGNPSGSHHSDDQLKDELLELITHCDVKLEIEEENAKPPLSVELLQEFLLKANELAEISINIDPVITRSHNFKNQLENLLIPYKELLSDLVNES